MELLVSFSITVSGNKCLAMSGLGQSNVFYLIVISIEHGSENVDNTLQ